MLWSTCRRAVLIQNAVEPTVVGLMVVLVCSYYSVKRAVLWLI